MSKDQKEKLSSIALIVTIATPVICLIWFVINQQIDFVKADVLTMKIEQTKHREEHKALLDKIPEKKVIETQYNAIKDSLVKINIELENCRNNDKDFQDKLYELIKDIKK